MLYAQKKEHKLRQQFMLKRRIIFCEIIHSQYTVCAKNTQFIR